MQSLPTGKGSLYTKLDNGRFKWQTMALSAKGNVSKKWSYESIKWLNWHQNDSRFLSDDGARKFVIRHALNGDEEIITVNGRNYEVDGYVDTGSEIFIFEFFGCFWHKCEYGCNHHRDAKSFESDKQRIAMLKTVGTVEFIYGCEWEEKKKTIEKFRNFTSHFFHPPSSISSTEIEAAIINGDLFGFVKCTLTTPSDVAEKFLAINHPPIYTHQIVTEDLVGADTIKRIKEIDGKLSDKRQLTLSFNKEQGLFFTPLLRKYLQLGVEMVDVSMVVEYEKANPLQGFVKKLTEQRIQAAIDKDDQKQLMAKLLVNAGYGRFGMDTTSHKRNTFVKSDDKLQKVISRKKFVKNFQDVEGEFASGWTEVQQLKASKIKQPIHFALAVTSWAKWKMLDFVELLIEYADVNRFRLMYTDTDSFHFAAAEKELYKLAKIGKEQVFKEILDELIVPKECTDHRRKKWPGKCLNNFVDLKLL